MSGFVLPTGISATNMTILLTNKTKTVRFKTHKQRSTTMQFDFEKVKGLLGKVVYIQGQKIPNLEPYVVCGHNHKDNFLQLCSLVSGGYISGLHTDNVTVANIGED